MNRAMHRICAPWVAGLGILAFVAGPVFAQTQSLPVRKPGLWEVTIRGAGDSMMRQQKVQQCTSEEAESIIERINMIQDDIMVLELDLYTIWLLFERDTKVGEVFKCNPPGFAMMMPMPFLKNDLHKRLCPNTAYAGSTSESILEQVDAIMDHMSGLPVC